MTPSHLDIKVSGFRSLRNTEFTLRAGLNVFVGPNGSGKTNIAALIDFVSAFISDGIHTAFAKAGGAFRVISNEALADSNEEQDLEISITGVSPYTPESTELFNLKRSRKPSEVPKEQKIKFRYGVILHLDREKFDVVVQRESLEWEILEENSQIENHKISTSANTPGELVCSFEREVSPIFSRIFKENLLEVLKGINKKQDSLTNDMYGKSKAGKSLFESVRLYKSNQIQHIQDSLTFRRSINIDPQKVRQEEDLSSDRRLKPDGTGLIGSLYRLRGTSRHPRKGVFVDILNDLKKMNEGIIGLDIEPSLQTGKFSSTLRIGKRAGRSLALPFSAISDGTAKWLALITAVRSVESGFCIEEPENYLHPEAQRQFINILRDVAESRPSKIYVITTHSETVVNMTKPDELLLCNYKRLSTRVRRLGDLDKIRTAINETGFGLGFLYSHDRV